MDEHNLMSVQDTKPLTTWKNPPTLSELKQNLQDAKPIQDTQATKIQGFLDNLTGTGKASIKVPKGNSAIVPKLIRKQAEWRYPALSEPFLSTDELFNVRPVSWEDRKAALQNELLLNTQFNTRIDKIKFIDEYVRTAVDEGTVIVQVGWDFEEEEVEEEEPVVEFRVNPAMAQTHEQLAQMLAQSPEQFASEVPPELQQAHSMSMQTGQPMEPVVLGYRKVMRTKTVRNCPTVVIRNTRNVVIDPTCEGDMDKARFVVHSFETSLAELRKDSRYKNLDTINIQDNTILGAPDHLVGQDTQSFNFTDKARQKFVAYEYWGYWDIEGTGKVKPFVATWVGDVMIRMEENPFPDKKLPFVVVQYLPVRKSIYGEPDGALLEDNQRIIGAVTRGMIDILAKSANGQTGIRRDMLDATNRRKYDAGLDYEFNQNVDPRQGVFMHTYPEIPASAQFMLQLQNLEAEAITGVKAYNSGISSASLGDVAAGIRGALDAASKRELGILRRLSSGVVQVGRKILAMNREFLSEEEVIRITNEEFVTVRRDDLPGDFDLKLSISTAEEDNNKAEQLAFMLQTVGPNEDPSVRRMILADICRLRKMPDLAKRLEEYQPQPDPLMQEKAQLEVALLRSQVEENQARSQKYLQAAQLDAARSGTEGAKQGHLNSAKDLLDLDFVEQESGVKQERDMQKQGEQARAQAYMKQADHGMSMEREMLKENLKRRNA